MLIDLPWTEKYRPKSLKDVIGQRLIVERLKSFVERGNFPNMIFAGSPGIGKTVCAVSMANDLYGDNARAALKELNASVTPDTPILIKIKSKIERTTIGEISSRYFVGDEKYTYPEDLEVLTIDKNDFKVKFSQVSNISRHLVKRVQEIKVEGGGVETTSEHSVIIINEKGELQATRACDLKIGDFLITFNTSIDANLVELDLSRFKPDTSISWGPVNNRRVIQNPKVKNVLHTINVDKDLAWFFGSYLAEGAIGFRGNTSGVSVLTYAYPKEYDYVEFSASVISKLGFNSHEHTIVSGTSGRESAMQLTVSSTQLARFFKEHFYNNSLKKVAPNKRMPSFVFNLPEELRHKFLQGYSGDASGKWGTYLRYSSVSKDLLIDTAWLARISGLESSYFGTEARIIWKIPSYSYVRNELLPTTPFINFMKSIEQSIDFNWRYELRHALYSKKSDSISKRLLEDMISKINTKNLNIIENLRLDSLKRLLQSDISVAEVKSIRMKDYSDYVYDFSVPGSEMFWGGTIPLLLHNSDERGIDVIRGTVKEFAKTISIAKVSLKIIFLDEADALTSDAQHALRRTMEQFSAETRFILSANYASKIIEPIQSRCVVFRFKPLTEEDMHKYIHRIMAGESLQMDEKAIDALIYVGDGDLRRLTNVLQSAAMQHKHITETSIYDIAARARPKEIVAMLRYAISGDFINARNELDNLMLKHGMSAEDILTQCYKEAQNLDADDRLKLTVIKDIGEYNFRIVEGANERIQLEAMLAGLALVAKKEK